MTNGDIDGTIALVPRAEDSVKLAVPGGQPEKHIHLTLIYLGDDVTSWTAARRAEVMLAAGRAVLDVLPIEAKAFGHGTFNPNAKGDKKPCAVYLIGNSQFLTPLRASLTQYAAAEQHEPFTSHITAGYGLSTPLSYTGPVVFDRLRVALADQVMEFPLGNRGEIMQMLTELAIQNR